MKLKYIDPRHIQIFNNTFMMVYGYLYLNFSRSMLYLVPAFIVSLLLDIYLSKYFNKDRDNRSFYDRASSVVNTIASVYVIVNVGDPMFYFLAVVFGIASKFIFRVKNEHVFNPANIGVVLSLLFISDSTIRIIYSQFASPKTFIFWFVIVNGLLITIWAKRLVLALAYLIGSSVFLYFLSPLFHYSNLVLIGPLFSTSGLLFTFFMITDPKTTPSKWNEQILFGLFCALVGAVLRANEMVHDAFVALFLTTAAYSMIRFTRLEAIKVPNAAAKN